MTTYPTELHRAHTWIVGGDTGLSSKHIWAVMMGVEPIDPYHPADPDDFGRCLRLLDAVPEWKPRIGEMAAQGAEWAALTARWAEVEALFLTEGGSLDPRPGTSRSAAGHENAQDLRFDEADRGGRGQERSAIMTADDILAGVLAALSAGTLTALVVVAVPLLGWRE